MKEAILGLLAFVVFFVLLGWGEDIRIAKERELHEGHTAYVQHCNACAAEAIVRYMKGR